jgi:hypothetical protein
MTTKKKLPKINRRRAAGSGSGYSWDLGNICFGDPMELIGQGRNTVRLQKYHDALFPKESKSKGKRRKIQQKNDNL